MNRARLEWHKRRQADTTDYIRRRNHQAMREWLEVWSDVDRNNPDVLMQHAEKTADRAVRLIRASQVLEGERREGALKRAGRFLRETKSLELRAARLRAGEKPLDDWATCRCGAAFQPGERGYTVCWTCSSKDWSQTSYTCIFCGRRHSMSYPLCFLCKLERSEDDARFIRTMVNRRDNYTCQLCGIDAMEIGCELQVSHIIPVDQGGEPDAPWNYETLCMSCSALKGKHYDKLDERAYWTLVQAYSEQLWDYLSDDERAALLALEPDWEGGEQIDFSAPPKWRTEDEVEEKEGVMNVVSILGAVLA